MSRMCSRLVSIVSLGCLLIEPSELISAPCEVALITANDGASADHFGVSVSVSGDNAIVGAWNDNAVGSDSGSAYIFSRTGVAWTQDVRLTANDAAPNDFFGFSVSLSGNYAIIGAYGNDDAGSNSGSAYVFQFSIINNSWTQLAKLTAFDAAGTDQFGAAVAIDGDYAVVGARMDDGVGVDSGSAYVFLRTGDVWSEQAKLIALDEAAGDQFGYAVAISGDTVIIGAYKDDDAGTDSGSAYVFKRSGTVWSQEAKLLAADGAANDAFGYAVALDGDDAVVGAYLDDDDGSASGSAYVYHRTGTAWAQQAKLVADDANGSENFGYAVALEGDAAIIGAYQEDVSGQLDAGAAYLFERQGTVWTQQAKLIAGPDELNSQDRFGCSASLEGGNVLLGACDDNASATDSGSAFLFFVGQGTDCNANGASDVCDIVSGAAADCNVNDVPDECDIAAGTSEDCSANGTPDECEPDCNESGLADSCDILGGTSEDCSGDGIPDECLAVPLLFDDFSSETLDPAKWVLISDATVDATGLGEPSPYTSLRLNGNPDGGDELRSADLDLSMLPSAVLSYSWERTGGGEDPDPGEDLLVEFRDAAGTWVLLNDYPGAGPDMIEYQAEVITLPVEALHATFAVRFTNSGSPGPNDDWFVDDVRVAPEGSPDCNLNGVPDACDILDGTSDDCSGDGIPDECESDCNGNGVVDSCDISSGTSADCNGNDFPDECDIELAQSEDCNDNGIPDECGEFCESLGIQLLANVQPFEVGASTGNVCWGYVSPSGREYAIMGYDTGTAFFEVTDPANPVLVELIDGVISLWRDVKAYDHYAYAVTEQGDGIEVGIQVMDIGQIDDGIVTFVGNVITGGTQVTHTLALNADSGYLYRSGGGSEGFRVYSLANPANPEYVGEWSDVYCHEVTPISYVDGPYAGREIVFCCGGLDGGFSQTGLYTVDATDKSDMFLVSYYGYPNAAFAHQGWPSPDLKYFYIDDEFDETTFGIPATTHVIDITDLENPFEASTFTNGVKCIDHNLYTMGRFIFESNYTSGLRVFDATDPIQPVEIGFFDTFADGNPAVYDGLWSNYPYLPSGIVLGSDISRGFYVWDISALVDCNDNGIDDGMDISDGTSSDCDVDRVPDECRLIDCNANCVPDDDDISAGTSDDADGNGIPDECEGCDGDANGDGLVDPLDAGYIQARFGCSVGTGDAACDAADVNGDGTVDPLDGGYVLARFGTCL